MVLPVTIPNQIHNLSKLTLTYVSYEIYKPIENNSLLNKKCTLVTLHYIKQALT